MVVSRQKGEKIPILISHNCHCLSDKLNIIINIFYRLSNRIGVWWAGGGGAAPRKGRESEPNAMELEWIAPRVIIMYSYAKAALQSPVITVVHMCICWWIVEAWHPIDTILINRGEKRAKKLERQWNSTGSRAECPGNCGLYVDSPPKRNCRAFVTNW